MNADVISDSAKISTLEKDDHISTNKSFDDVPDEKKLAAIGTDKDFKHEIVWFKVYIFLLLHLAGLYGGYLLLTGHVQLKSLIYLAVLYKLGGEGIAMGAHRLYTHKSFKATPFLRAMFIIMQTISGQNSMWVWTRDHRQHHKYSDTDADPHNASRGLFFSHVGWLMSRKHPKVIEYGRKIDMSDVSADKLVMFQKKHYLKVYFVVGFLIPTLIPMYFWNESFTVCFFTFWAARTAFQWNATWLLNSLCHAYGYKPYDKTIKPTESVVIAFFTSGEAWHNYHHTFPWDYRSAEMGMIFNQSALFIDICAWLGLAYDLRSATPKMIESFQKRLGDGSYSDIKNLPYVERASILFKKFVSSCVNLGHIYNS